MEHGPETFQKVDLVVDQEDGKGDGIFHLVLLVSNSCGRCGDRPQWQGSATVTTVPAPGCEENRREPPCSLTMDNEMESPSPVPPRSSRVEKKGSVTLA